MSHNAIPADTRAAVETALADPQDDRGRAELSRTYGVSTRTISRWADALGVDPGERWSTADTAKATEAATDRRRALRSQLADDLLLVEIPRVRALLAEEVWSKTVVIPGDGGGSERVNEDDAIVARGLKDALTAISVAVRTTVDIDKHDVATEDDGTGATLTKLFDGLATAYTAITGRQPTDEGDPTP